MLLIENSALLVIDVQGKLAEQVHNSTEVIDRCAKMIQMMQVLQIPVLHMEHNPEGLGKTTPKLAELLVDSESFEKITFSSLGLPLFKDALEALGRKQILLCGIEAHICIYQTALELLENKYEVNLLMDAISSQRVIDKEIAAQKLVLAGAQPSTVEMAVYELLATAKHPAFRDILHILKSNG